MKRIIYEFEDGTKSEIEVEDKWADFVTVSRREEENSNRKERYHTAIHLDRCEYEGDWFIDKETPATAYEKELQMKELEEEEKRVEEFISSLSEVQRRRLQYKLNNPKISYREISRIENVQVKAVTKTFEQVQKKFKDFFGDRVHK